MQYIAQLGTIQITLLKFKIFIQKNLKNSKVFVNGLKSNIKQNLQYQNKLVLN